MAVPGEIVEQVEQIAAEDNELNVSWPTTHDVALVAEPLADAHARESLALLSEVSVLLHQSIDFEATLRTIASLAVPTLADYCVFDLIDNGVARRVAAAHANSARQALVDDLCAIPPDLNAPGLAKSVIESGVTAIVEEWDADAQPWNRRNADLARIVAALEPRSVIATPMSGRDGTIFGVLSFILSESGRRYARADIPLIETLATRAAVALENARLHRSVVEARDRLEAQRAELEAQAEQLQDQATELEAQQAELEMQTDELQSLTQELAEANAVMDIARQEAQAGEQYVTSILSAIADPFVVHDKDWRFRYVNPAAAESLGRAGSPAAGQSVIGRVVWDVYPDLRGSTFEREMRRAQDENRPVVFEEYYAKRGAWTEQRCYPLADGGVATIWRNITAQKQAEERLRYLSQASDILSASLDYHTTISRLANLLVPRLADWCGVQLLDDDGKLQQVAVAHVDPAKVEWARQIEMRYPVDMSAPTGAPNVLRTGKSELYADISDEMIVAAAVDAEHLAMIRALGMTSVLIVPLIARDRVIGVMSLIAAESGRRYTDAERDLAQELAHRAALAIDNARLYTETKQARTEAEQANRAKSEFLAHMSHELRTPLNAIAGYADLMELGVHGPLSDEAREDIARIKRAQRHLLGLINDVLNFAKLEAGSVSYEIEAFNARDLIASLEPLIHPQVQEKSLRLSIDASTSELIALGDVEKVEQILLNLLSNAVKFTPPGGAITVRGARTPTGVEIEVADTGVGIPAEKLEAIFEPFVQLRRPMHSPTDGTGLGLAISRDLAEHMGGSLTAQSTVGRGSRFRLRLPAK